ncbi:MAG: thioredoxin [Alphaproteobacteria bacterium]|nr:MAG: thioredoxin [Alphaproteobacteria bacterium]
MDLDFGNGKAGGGALVKDATSETFVADVIEASRQRPVLVDFWAPWCGPCKTLTPLLEKLVKAQAGRLWLVKVNVDENQRLAQQLRVQSVPTVFAFLNGQPVDGFAGAVPESQLKAFIERLLAAAPRLDGADEDVAALLELGEAALAAGETERAAMAFGQVLEVDGQHVGALAGLARCHVAGGQLAQARALLARVPADKRGQAAVAAAAAALALAEETAEAGDPALLRARLADHPDDHATRYALAQALLARGEREAAMEALLAIVARDRDWNDGAAKRLLLKIFDAAGPEDPLTVVGRRRLSSILFS